MLSRHLVWERTPPGGIHAGEQRAIAGHRGPQELLIGKPLPGRPYRRAHVVSPGEQGLFWCSTSGVETSPGARYVPGSNCLAV
jgi:hypothetical protein